MRRVSERERDAKKGALGGKRDEPTRPPKTVCLLSGREKGTIKGRRGQGGTREEDTREDGEKKATNLDGEFYGK